MSTDRVRDKRTRPIGVCRQHHRHSVLPKAAPARCRHRYGLSEGIRDGILKEVAGNIYSIDFRGNEKEYLSFLVEDFFKTYGDVTLADGTPAKLAIFLSCFISIF